MTDHQPSTGTVNPPSGEGHYVYVLRCGDGSLYTGYTTNVSRRIAQHKRGEGAKYTRGRTPITLVHVESFDTKPAAMRREYEIKGLSKQEKEQLVDQGRDLG